MTADAGTRYARSGDAHIAYQVLGEGVPTSSICPRARSRSTRSTRNRGFPRFHRGLASFSRLIRMDLRGIGLSDPIDPSVPPSLEQWVGDALAVLDAVGSERAALCGADEGALVAMLTAAAHPTRTAALILLNAYPRLRRDSDYPHGLPDHLVTRFTKPSSPTTTMRGPSRTSRSSFPRLRPTLGSSSGGSGPVTAARARRRRSPSRRPASKPTSGPYCLPSRRPRWSSTARAIAPPSSGTVGTSPTTFRGALRRAARRRAPAVRRRQRHDRRRDRGVPHGYASRRRRPRPGHDPVLRHRAVHRPRERARGPPVAHPARRLLRDDPPSARAVRGSRDQYDR